MRTLLAYPLPTGARALVVVDLPDGQQPVALLDVPLAEPLPRDAHCTVVGLFDDDVHAFGAAVDHMLLSELLGRPAAPPPSRPSACESAPFSMMSYSLPTGARSLVLVEDTGAEHPFTVLDIPLDSPVERDDDCVLVARDLPDYFRAREVAHEHWLRSERMGRPASAAASTTDHE